MWVLLWGGKTVAWLNGNAELTIGRKGTTLIVSDDPSISRLHVTLNVGISAGATPAPLTITDNSKYGTAVRVLESATVGPGTTHATEGGGGPDAERTALKPGVDWTVPLTARRFALELGTHSAAFDARWVPSGVAFVGIPDVEAGALAETVHTCGAHRVKTPTQLEAVKLADIVVTPKLEPLAAVVAALCLASPIVGPQYYQTILSRLGPKIPPADPGTLEALPSAIADQWASILRPGDEGTIEEREGDAAGNSNKVTGIRPTLFLPRPERRTVFARLKFVTFQDVLFRELSAYVPCAGGDVVHDALPAAAASERVGSLAELLSTYAVRHSDHVLVFTPLAPLNQRALDALRGHGIATVDYQEVLRAILLGSASSIPSPRYAAALGGLAGSSELEAAGGRGSGPALPTASTTDALQPVGQGAAQAILDARRHRSEIGVQKPLGSRAAQELDAAIEPTLRRPPRTETAAPPPAGDDADPQPELSAAGDGGGQRSVCDLIDDGKVMKENLIVTGPPKLPPHPCFRGATGAAGEGDHRDPGMAAPADGSSATIRRKTFRKQHVHPLRTAFVDVVTVAPERPGARDGEAPRIARVDALDVVPDYGNFDAIPATNFARSVPARGAMGPARGRGSRAAAAAAAPAVDHAVVDISDDDVTAAAAPAPASPAAAAAGKCRAAPRGKRGSTATAPPPPPPPPAAPTAAGGGGGIFGVDALY